jgi:Rad3-related DNA helicase
VTLKPVYVHHFVSPLLFKYGNAVVLLSATFLDVNVLCRSLGIDKEHVAARRMKNRFPAKNRPIYLKTVAKMVGGKANMHNWAPAMTKAVNEISLKYPDKKGIIHTQNFAILDHLLEHCDKRVSRRFLTQRQYPNKQELMKMHVECDNTIIVAPAMHEGVDLHGDLSRFQIICKVPYPDRFSNKQLDRRADIDPKYYNWLTALRLVQSAGRSIRSETDYADTYIIDEAIYRFLDMAGNILPDWFKEAIIK